MKVYINFFIVAILVLFSNFLVVAVSAQTQTSFIILNEIEVNNPGTDTIACEYIELRGDANTFVPANTYLVEIEGDGTVAGTADLAINLGTSFIGSNGILVVTPGGVGPIPNKNVSTKNLGISPCGTRSYSSDGATILPITITLENGTISFLLINSPTTAIIAGTDYDTDNNGTLDALPQDAIIIDAVGWSDGGVGDFVYGGIDVTPANTSGAPDAATRNFENIIPLSSAAWFADDLVGAIDSVSYDQTNLLGGYIIDFITPGAQNLAPSSAAANISGRVIDRNGRGLKFVTVMLTGNSLSEPLYATTNMFGRYRFEDLPVGEIYVLQVFSKRYTFEQSSMVISLDENINNANFIGVER